MKRSVPHLDIALIAATALFVGCDAPGGFSSTPIPATCGNGALDPSEVCDGPLVGNQSCQSAGYERGILVCNQSCSNFDFTGCSGGTGSPDVTSPDTSSAPDASPTDGTSASNDSGPGGDDAPAGGQPPRIVSVNASHTVLQEGQTLTVTAVVADPDGLADIAGGDLFDVATGRAYRGFEMAAGEGEYNVFLTWSDLTAIGPLTAPPSGVDRALRVVFRDYSGAKASQDLSVKLRCDVNQSNLSLCDSTCVDLQKDNWNCGSCGVTGTGTSCENGALVCARSNQRLCGSTCLDVEDNVEHCGACGHDCGAVAAVFSRVDGVGCDNQICVVVTGGAGPAIAAGGTCATFCASAGLACAEDYESWFNYGENGRYVDCDEAYTGSDPIIGATCACEEGTPAPVTPGTTATIVGIQSSAASVGCASSGDQSVGAAVTIEGVVAVGRFDINSSLAGMVVSDGSQSAYSSVLVRFPKSQTWAFAPGRRVRITGSHYEYYCQTQFAATAMTDIGSGSVPAPVAIGKGLSAQELERWEGVVVSLSDVTVTGLNSFDDAETDAGLLLDNQILGAAFVTPPVGERYTTLRGLIVWIFDRYRIAPRSASDY